MSDALKAKLIQDHYAIVTPSSWANGPKYAVYIVSTTPPENSIYPSTASDAVDPRPQRPRQPLPFSIAGRRPPPIGWSGLLVARTRAARRKRFPGSPRPQAAGAASAAL